MINRTRTAMALLVLAHGLAGCGASPWAPSPIPAPVPVAPRLAPVLTEILPITGSTGGDTAITITGSGFYGAAVTLDGIAVRASYDVRSPDTKIYLETSAHAAGTVDVVVTNLDGQSSRLTAAYTYASPESFAFNGNWAGDMMDGSHSFISFTIQNNRVVSLSCDSSTLALQPPPSIVNGAFSFLGNGGVSVSGKIVSASQAFGAINMGSCTSKAWRGWPAVNNSASRNAAER